MDISDIELVIVYGVPDGMNQLYQVPEISIIMYKNEVIHQHVLSIKALWSCGERRS